jgi:multidrug transporter EmrE-like cation transporter
MLTQIAKAVGYAVAGGIGFVATVLAFGESASATREILSGAMPEITAAPPRAAVNE